MSDCWKLQNFGEVLEALYAGCHPKLHILMCNSSCFLGRHQRLWGNPSKKSHKITRDSTNTITKVCELYLSGYILEHFGGQ